jgi:broad specificity phosphatase PhoE
MKSFCFRFCAITLACGLCFLLSFASSAQNQEAVWAEFFQGRAVALLRHATAPGLGDPPGFRIGDCSTQRNLSQEGRQQARRIGDFFRAKGVKEATIYSSQWCRCLETARLLNLGQVNELPSLNSFFQNSSSEKKQTTETRHFISSLPTGKPVIMVSHQVNITALTGIFPSSGEIIMFRYSKNKNGDVIGRFKP